MNNMDSEQVTLLSLLLEAINWLNNNINSSIDVGEKVIWLVMDQVNGHESFL